MSKCFSHKDAQAIAECRVCGKNVCDECAIDLGSYHGVACCIQCEQKARTLIYKEKSRGRIYVFSFLGISVVLTLALVFPMLGHVNLLSLLFSVIVVAGGIVVSIWFVFYFTWHTYMWITRGAPFHIGDYVVVTDGPHTGACGKVLRVGDRLSVAVALETNDGSSIYHFDWNQIRKMKKKRTPSEKSMSPPPIPSVSS